MFWLFEAKKLEVGYTATPPSLPAPSRYHHYHHKWFAIFIIHFLVKMLMPKIHSARRRCIMLFLANTWPLWTYCSNQELMWSVWTSAVTRHCTMLLEWTVKPLWWWAFKQPSSQGFHSLLLREKSWEPVCFLYFLNTRTFSLTVSLLYKHLRIILGKLWKSSGNERKHLCYLQTVSPKPLCKQWLETWKSLKGPFPA